MGKLSAATAGVIMAAALFGVSSAQAATLLSLIDPPGQTGTMYDLIFKANADTTTISFGGYQTSAFEYVSGMSVTHGGGTNLLSTAWTLTKARCLEATPRLLSDGTGVPALWFGGFSSGY